MSEIHGGQLSNTKLSRRHLLRYGFIGGLAGIPLLSAPYAHAAAIPRSFTYVNPIESVTLRDCQIVRQDHTYYMTGTFPPFGSDGPFKGVHITKSTDLLHWSRPIPILRPDPHRWYQKLFWAPEIFPHTRKFFLTFNCPANGAAPIVKGTAFPQSVGLAVADAIDGPYRVLTNDRPLLAGNDATLFVDTDGRVYLYSVADPGVATFQGDPELARFSGIVCSEVNLDTGSIVGKPGRCLSKGDIADWDGGEKVAIEGPSVFLRNGIYYLLYSSWRRGYEVGYAIADNPRGPWRKYSGNPIYGAQDPEWCKMFNGAYTQSPDVPFGQVGHGSPFFGPDGRIWFCCHGIEQKGRGKDIDPHLIITPMEFEADGSIAMTLTWTPQTVPISASERDPIWRPSGTPASTTPRRI